MFIVIVLISMNIRLVIVVAVERRRAPPESGSPGPPGTRARTSAGNFGGNQLLDGSIN